MMGDFVDDRRWLVSEVRNERGLSVREWAHVEGDVFLSDDPAYLRLTSVASSSASTTYTYFPAQAGNGANLLQTEQTAFAVRSHTTDTIAYTYDALNRVSTRAISSSEADPGATSTETWQYDWLGRIHDVSDLNDFIYRYADLTPRPAEIDTPFGPTLTLTFGDAHGGSLLDGMSWADAALNQWAFSYYADGRIATSQHNGDPIASYAYDSWGELQSVSTPGQTPFTYTYDANGNIETANGPSGNQSFAVSSDNDRLWDVTYDARGNVTSANGSQYRWDGANRLVDAQNGSSGTESTFAYDGLGRLIEVGDFTATSSRQAHLYSWCGGSPCMAHEENGSGGAPVSNRYYAQGAVDYFTGDYSFYKRDRLGTPGGTSDPFGAGSPGDTGDSPLNSGHIGFAGYWCHDWTGLCFAGARVYSPQLKRWLSRDPIGQAGGLNPYQYASNDPTNQTDPSGLCPQCVVGALIGAGAGAWGAYATGGDVLAAAAGGAVTGGLAGLTGGLSFGGQLVGSVAAGLTAFELNEGARLLEGSNPASPQDLAASLTSSLAGPGFGALWRTLTQPTISDITPLGDFALRRALSEMTAFGVKNQVKSICK